MIAALGFPVLQVAVEAAGIVTLSLVVFGGLVALLAFGFAAISLFGKFYVERYAKRFGNQARLSRDLRAWSAAGRPRWRTAKNGFQEMRPTQKPWVERPSVPIFGVLVTVSVIGLYALLCWAFGYS